MKPDRILHHADALSWLTKLNEPLAQTSIITSMPDISEFRGWSVEEWKNWFTGAAQLVLSRCSPDAITIFYQTDIKREGVWIDKAFLCQKAAEKTGDHLLAHIIICRAPAGTASFGRIGYSHLLCFSKSIRHEDAKSVADVAPDAGATTWTRGMGLEACRIACEFVKNHSDSHTILDPFCGHGSVLSIANQMGLHAIGVDRSLKFLKRAETLELSPR